MQFGLSKGYDINPYKYEALAWAGLYCTPAFLELDRDEQDTIKDINAYEDFGDDILAEGEECS